MVALGLVFFVLFLAYYMGSGGSSKYPDMASEAFPKICFFYLSELGVPGPVGLWGILFGGLLFIYAEGE